MPRGNRINDRRTLTNFAIARAFWRGVFARSEENCRQGFYMPRERVLISIRDGVRVELSGLVVRGEKGSCERRDRNGTSFYEEGSI